MDWVREEFRGRFEQMVQLGADEPGQARKRDQGFGLAGIFGRDSAAGEVGAQHEVCAQHGAGDHQSEGGNGEGADVEERNHAKQYNVIVRGDGRGAEGFPPDWFGTSRKPKGAGKRPIM